MGGSVGGGEGVDDDEGVEEGMIMGEGGACYRCAW